MAETWTCIDRSRFADCDTRPGKPGPLFFPASAPASASEPQSFQFPAVPFPPVRSVLDIASRRFSRGAPRESTFGDFWSRSFCREIVGPKTARDGTGAGRALVVLATPPDHGGGSGSGSDRKRAWKRKRKRWHEGDPTPGALTTPPAAAYHLPPSRSGRGSGSGWHEATLPPGPPHHACQPRLSPITFSEAGAEAEAESGRHEGCPTPCAPYHARQPADRRPRGREPPAPRLARCRRRAPCAAASSSENRERSWRPPGRRVRATRRPALHRGPFEHGQHEARQLVAIGRGRQPRTCGVEPAADAGRQPSARALGEPSISGRRTRAPQRAARSDRRARHRRPPARGARARSARTPLERVARGGSTGSRSDCRRARHSGPAPPRPALLAREEVIEAAAPGPGGGQHLGNRGAVEARS